jgi:antitoxin HicB
MVAKRRKSAPVQYKVPLVLTPQPEGGFTVTSPLLPELITEGDSADEAIANVKDALAAVIEIYEELGKPLPQNARVVDASGPLWFETLVTAP